MISIIIVNFKTPQLTLRCIKSIVETVSTSHEIIVVDNNSDDDSELLIKSYFPQVIWINELKNHGFGRANNIGSKIASGEFLLLLNSDIILKPNTIDYCFNKISANRNIGVLGCLLRNEDGTHQKSTYHYVGDFRSILTKNVLFSYFFQFKTPAIKAVMGSFMMIPKNVFIEVNGFDEDFFMYSEELEMCHRIHNVGYMIEYTHQVEAIHKNGGSWSGANWSHKQNYLSNALLFLKVKGVFGYFWYHVLSILTFFCNLITLFKMDESYRADFWKDTNCYFSNFSYYLIIPFKYSKKQNSSETYLRRY